MADNINALAGAVALLGFADDSGDTLSSSRACDQDNVGGDVSAAERGLISTASLRTASGLPARRRFLPAYNDAGAHGLRVIVGQPPNRRCRAA